MLDLNSFIQHEVDKISQYEMPKNQIFDEGIDFNWAAEQILILFTRWTTGLTKTILRQDLLNQRRTFQSSHEIKPDATHHHVLHGKIHEIGMYEGNQSAIMHISQNEIDYVVKAAVHGALLPFINIFLRSNRTVHFADIRFSGDYMIPNQLCVIDLLKIQKDMDFVIKKSQPILLKNLTDADEPEGLLLHVKSPTQQGIMVSDGKDTIEFFLEEDRRALRQLLRFGDIILVYKPWIRQIHAESYCIIYGPQTVIFRVPVSVETNDGMSQISQRPSNQSQSGLQYRNSTASRSIHGTVIGVRHNLNSDSEVTGSTLESSQLLIHAINECGDSVDYQVHVTKIGSISYDIIRTLCSVKLHHYVWMFGLFEQSPGTLIFTAETTIFNTSQLYTIVVSNIVIPRPLSDMEHFSTFLARATITKIEVSVINVHKLCHTYVQFGKCPTCKSELVNDDFEKEFKMQLTIDDTFMSCDPITAYGLGSTFSFWTAKPQEWSRLTQQKKDEHIQSLIGQEFVFVLSTAKPKEFGSISSSLIWRVDQCIKAVGDTEREIQNLCKWHSKLDQENP